MCRISFIGHSLGGVIIRAAIPHLKEFSDRFCSFISFSSPHLGFLYGSSNLVDAGLWVMKKFMKIQSINQLSLKDAKKIEDCFLYKLSKMEVINFVFFFKAIPKEPTIF